MDACPVSRSQHPPSPNKAQRGTVVVRIVVAIAFALAAWLVARSLPHRSACWRVHAVDWAFRQKAFSELGLHEIEEANEQARRDNIPMEEAIRRRLDASRTSEQKRLGSLPLNEFIRASVKGRSLDVSGAEWSAFFQAVEDALAQKSLPPKWAHAADARSLRNNTFHSIFLSPREAPLAGLPQAARDGRPWYLRLVPSEERYLEVEWITPGRDQGQEIGPYDFPTSWRVPEIFRWPLRHLALWLAALAAALPFATPMLHCLRALRDLPRPSAAGAYAEMLRRVALFGLCASAPVVACWTYLAPYWILQTSESKEATRRAWVNMAMPLIAKTLPEAKGDPAKAREITEQMLVDRNEPKPEVIDVDGEEWRSLIESAEAVFGGGQLPDGWLRRVSDYTRRDLAHPMPLSDPPKVNRLTFWRDERPMAELASALKMRQSYLLRLQESKAPPLLISLMPEPEVSGFGHTSFGVPTPMAYPLRPAWPWLAGIGLASYLLIPWRRIGPDTIAWPTWRLVLGDLASALLFLPFFGMPLFIIGSTQQALSTYLPFTAIFWILAALGAYLIFWTIRYACWAIHMLPDGIEIESLTGRRPIAFKDITGIQRAVIKPPKWLVVLSYLAALLPSRGSARAGQAGRALLLSSSCTSGLILHLRNGRSPVIWFTDQMGSVAVSHFDKLTSALEEHQIPQIEEIVELRRIIPPDEIEAAKPTIGS